MRPCHVAHDRQQHAGRDDLLARVRLDILDGEAGERGLGALGVERVGMAPEQRLHRDRGQARVGLRVATARLAQQLGPRPGHVPFRQRRMNQAVRKHRPRGVDIADQAGEAEHGEVELRLDRHDAAGAIHRVVGVGARELLRAEARGAQQQRFDTGGALGELLRAPQQVQPHRDDVARRRAALDDADAGRLIHSREAVACCEAAGPPLPGQGAEQHGEEQQRDGAIHGDGFFPPRSQATTDCVSSGGASTPITRGWLATYTRAKSRRSSTVWAFMCRL